MLLLFFPEERILADFKAHLVFENDSNRLVHVHGIALQLQLGESIRLLYLSMLKRVVDNLVLRVSHLTAPWRERGEGR